MSFRHWFLLFLFHPIGWMVPLNAQSDFRLSIPARMDGGLNIARVERDPGSNWGQGLGTAVVLSSGIGVRYKERLTLNAELGVFFDTYNFSSNYAIYKPTHFTLQPQVNLGYLFKFRKDPSKAVVVGGAAGISLFSDDRKLRVEPGYFIRAEALGPNARFISPELGFARTWSGGQMSFLVTYLYHFSDTESTRVRIEEDNGSNFVARAKGDYIAFRLRANIDIKGHKPLKQSYPAQPRPVYGSELASRDTRQRMELTSKRQRVVLHFWDNADVDGDTISVSLNKRFVLVGHALDKHRKKVVIVLEPGENIIAVHAHNEGSVPPNTAACSVKTGLFRKETLVFSTNLKRNESIVINW